MSEVCESCGEAVEGELQWVSRQWQRGREIDSFMDNLTENEKKRMRKHGGGWNEYEAEEINKGNIDVKDNRVWRDD